MSRAAVSASAPDPTSLTPPALPRPPTSTWALITTRSAPAARIRSAAARASAAVRATSQPGTGNPWARQGLRVGFLDLHAGSELRDGLGAEPGDAMVPRRSARAGPNRSDPGVVSPASVSMAVHGRRPVAMGGCSARMRASPSRPSVPGRWRSMGAPPEHGGHASEQHGQADSDQAGRHRGPGLRATSRTDSPGPSPRRRSRSGSVRSSSTRSSRRCC